MTKPRGTARFRPRPGHVLWTAPCLASLLALGPALPALAEAEGGRVAEILAQARAECRADVMAGDPDAPEPELDVRPAAVTWLDLDGDHEKDDAIVDFNEVMCSLNYSLWHGSGGSLIHLVLDDAASATWTGGRWQVMTFGRTPLVLIGRHGGYCDGYGAQPCVQAIAITDGGFSTVTLDAAPRSWP